GGMIGVGCGLMFLTFTDFSVAAEGVSIAFRPSLDLALVGLVVSLVVGILAGIIPGWQASRTNIVDALQHAG
ncbi:MAG: ABC transporter permease, partial [bacterium]|nr:ABC transporter permease [bacterium]